jgi:catechol 1,2-dioxygenase
MKKPISKKLTQLTRREVLIQTTLGTAGLVVAGLGVSEARATNAAPRVLNRQPTPQCVETEDNILGPFYREGAPFRTVLASPDEGQPLVIDGTVFGPDCVPLPGALVDVWQANDAGVYDITSSDYLWRGRMLALDDGSYHFETILPGWYPTRPKHIHYKVSQDGFLPLTTQLYFEGDPYLKIDPYVRPSLIIPLTQINDVWYGTFDIVLGQGTGR